jgi:hypothetical protein
MDNYLRQNITTTFCILFIAIYFAAACVLRFLPGVAKNLFHRRMTIKKPINILIMIVPAVGAAAFGVDYFFLGGHAAAQMSDSYANVVRQLPAIVQQPTRQLGGKGVLIVDTNAAVTGWAADGVMMQKLPASCWAATDALPRTVILKETNRVKRGECIGACPGGHDIYETLYHYTVHDLAGGRSTNCVNCYNDVSRLAQEFCN